MHIQWLQVSLKFIQWFTRPFGRRRTHIYKVKGKSVLNICTPCTRVCLLGAMSEENRVWQPPGLVYQNQDSEGCQCQDGEEKNEMHFIPGLLRVNCDRVAPQLPSMSTSPRHPSHLLLLSLAAAARSVKKNREESGGWVTSTHNWQWFHCAPCISRGIFSPGWLLRRISLNYRAFVCFHLAERWILCVDNWTINTDGCYR